MAPAASTSLLFVVDATGSMGAYMTALRPVLAVVSQLLRLVAADGTRVGVLFYTDYVENRGEPVWFSGWGLSARELEAFVAAKALSNGGAPMVSCGVYPEAAKTAVWELLRVCGDRPTNVVWYTDAPPHHPDFEDVCGYRELAAAAAHRPPQSTDWVALCRAVGAAGHVVHTFLDTDNARVACFYAMLGDCTGGGAYHMLSLGPDDVARHTLGVFMSAVAGYDDDDTDDGIRRLSLGGPELAVDATEVACGGLLGMRHESPSRMFAEPLSSSAPSSVKSRRAEVALVQRFAASAAYRDAAYDVFEHLLQPSTVGALSYNAFLAAMWRRCICRDRGDVRRQRLCDAMSNLVGGTTASLDVRAKLKALLEASYDMTDDIEARIAAAEAAAAASDEGLLAVVLEVPEALRPKDRTELLEVGRSCGRKVIERFTKLLVLGVRAVPVGTPGSIPLSTPGLFRVLPHLAMRGTELGGRAAAVLAVICARANCEPLAGVARAHLASIRGTWIDAASPENLAPDFVALVVGQASHCLTAEELARFRSLRACDALRVHGGSALAVEVGFRNPGPTVRPDRKVRCAGCGAMRSTALMLVDATCAKCADGSGGDEEPCDDGQSRWCECHTCGVHYPVVVAPHKTVTPKCHFCRAKGRDDVRDVRMTAPHVRCSLCQNAFLHQSPDTVEDAARWTCAPCEANGGAALTETVHTTVRNYATENGAGVFGVELSVPPATFFGAASLFKAVDMATAVSTTTATSAEAAVHTSKRVKRVLNVPEIIAAFAAMSLGEFATPEKHGECAICCSATLKTELRPACARKRCDARACAGCLQEWYGEPARGQRDVSLARLCCAFCKQRPAPKVLRAYNRDALQLGQLTAELADARWLHGWCAACDRVRRTVERVCGGVDNGAIAADAFRCDDCDEDVTADVVVVHCPRCDLAIEKAGGCNHITCTCGAHFCWKCRFVAGEAKTVYDHLYGGCGLGLDAEDGFIPSDDEDDY